MTLLFHSLPVNPQPLSMLCCQKQHVGLDLMASHIVCSICLKRRFFFFRLMFNKTPQRDETVKLNENRLEKSLDGHGDCKWKACYVTKYEFKSIKIIRQLALFPIVVQRCAGVAGLIVR